MAEVERASQALDRLQETLNHLAPEHGEDTFEWVLLATTGPAENSISEEERHAFVEAEEKLLELRGFVAEMRKKLWAQKELDRLVHVESTEEVLRRAEELRGMPTYEQSMLETVSSLLLRHAAYEERFMSEVVPRFAAAVAAWEAEEALEAEKDADERQASESSWSSWSPASPSSPPKGKGKGPPPKGKGPGKGAKGKGKGPKAKAAPRIQGHAPLGRKIHWGAHYGEPHADSVFNSLDTDVRFNSELLKVMLSSEEKPCVPRRKSMAKRPTGITILDASRAQNVAIFMSKMKVSTEEFCQNLKELNFESCMSPDDFELLIHVLPTPEERNRLIEYRDRVQELRDVEQNVMPFCLLHRGVVRMKVAKFALSHKSSYCSVRQRCEALQSAAEQVRGSRHFREVLGVVLRVGNFINHGVGEVVEGAIRGISVDSLSSLASFKTGAVSTLHFLCLSLGSADSDFFQGLKQSLSNVHEASKEKTVLLKGSIEAFGKDVDTAAEQLTSLLDLPAEEREFAPSARREAELRRVMLEWSAEKDGLARIGDQAFKACAETQKYFSTSAKEDLPPSEAFFLHIANFLDQLQEAWLEIERNPRKWEDFAAAAGFQLRRKSCAVTHSSSDDRDAEPEGPLRRKPAEVRRRADSRRSLSFLSSSAGFDLDAGG